MLAFPVVFFALAMMLIYLGVSSDIFDLDDIRIYAGISIVTAGAYLVLYVVTYKLKYFRRR
jgi:hypothetical protein